MWHTDTLWFEIAIVMSIFAMVFSLYPCLVQLSFISGGFRDMAQWLDRKAKRELLRIDQSKKIKVKPPML